MRNLYLSFCAVLVFSGITNAQRISPGPDNNKYRISLPSFWKEGRKAWRILDEKLPAVCPELKGKMICGDDCNAGYLVTWTMSEPIILGQDTREITNTKVANPNQPITTFTTSRGASGRDTMIRSDASINNTANRDFISKWDVRVYYSFEFSLLLIDSKDSIVRRIILVDTNEVFVKRNELATNSRFENNPVYPASYLEQNQDKFLPRYNDLFAIVDEKILMLK